MHTVVCSYIKEKEKVKEKQRTEAKQKQRPWCTGKQKRGDIQNDVSLSEFAAFLQVYKISKKLKEQAMRRNTLKQNKLIPHNPYAKTK